MYHIQLDYDLRMRDALRGRICPTADSPDSGARKAGMWNFDQRTRQDTRSTVTYCRFLEDVEPYFNWKSICPPKHLLGGLVLRHMRWCLLDCCSLGCVHLLLLSNRDSMLTSYQSAVLESFSVTFFLFFDLLLFCYYFFVLYCRNHRRSRMGIWFMLERMSIWDRNALQYTDRKLSMRSNRRTGQHTVGQYSTGYERTPVDLVWPHTARGRGRISTKSTSELLQAREGIILRWLPQFWRRENDRNCTSWRKMGET